MKLFTTLLLLFVFISCANSKNRAYTASTPASPLVKTFLGIPLTDSIDFIRWNLTLDDDKYSIDCNYGIGKPNTNGFYNGGKKVSFSGQLKKEKNTYLLQNGDHILKLAELNNNLLHVLNSDNSLLVGGGGWSYALNSLSPVLTDQVNINAKRTVLADSIAFVGRTPCGIPNIPKSAQCYKLKWSLVLYSNNTYKLRGTAWEKEGGKRADWKIVEGKDGRIIYQLNDDKGNPYIHLLKLDEGVVIFTDEKGNLLVGDHDFSYTLNRKS
jgi:hypothetical protein